MKDRSFYRQERIIDLAELDEIYLVYKLSAEQLRSQYERFSGLFPKKLRNRLLGYVSARELMLRKLLDVACTYMRFPDELGEEK